MANPVLGVIVVAAVIAGAALVAYLTRRNAVYHAPVAVAGLGLPPGLVVFTSTHCHRCKDALAVARSLEVPLREVTFELESELQEQAGITGVPLTVVIDRSGTSIAQFAGEPRARSLRRAVERAGF